MGKGNQTGGEMMSKLEEVKIEVNKIIKSLYRKDGKVSSRKLKKHGFNDEAINWGDLGVSEVRQNNNEGNYIVLIDEAAPHCPDFQAYIHNEMYKKGFRVEISTEW